MSETNPDTHELPAITCDVDMVKEVVRFQTTDGELWGSRQSAEQHQIHIQKAEAADRILRSGRTFADILRAVGESVPDPVLEKVTKDSMFSIPHWQCSDEAGYKIARIETGMLLFVYGNAGSWSGPYGSKMSIRDLVGYAKSKNSILQP